MTNIFIDIETLRSPEDHRLQILEDVKADFKAPHSLSKAQAAIDLGLTDAKEIKFTSKDDMISRWEKELAETKSADVAKEKWEKTSFNPDVAPIACICIGWYEGKHYKTASYDINQFNGGEMAMLAHFHASINNICSANGTVVHKPNFIGHNIIKFDLPFIWKRSVINDVKICDGVKWVDARHGNNCFDNMVAWAGHGKMIGAQRLSDILGVKGKADDIDGSMVYDTWQENPEKVIEYCHSDVANVKRIYERLTK